MNHFGFAKNSPSGMIDVGGMYEVDVHRFLTEYAAVQAGFSNEWAKEIGKATQALDDPGDNRDAMFGGGANIKNMNDFHFVTRMRLHELREKAMEGCKCNSGPKFKEIGEYLHALEDTYSHSHGWLDRSRNYYGHIQISDPTGLTGYKFESPGFGHGLMGHHADFTWDYPMKSDKMAEKLYDELVELAHSCGVSGPVNSFNAIADRIQDFNRYKPQHFWPESHFCFFLVDSVTFDDYQEKIQILNSEYILDPVYTNSYHW